MPEDDPNVPLPGCFGCLGDIGPLALALMILGGVAVMHRADPPQEMPLVQNTAVAVKADFPVCVRGVPPPLIAPPSALKGERPKSDIS